MDRTIGSQDEGVLALFEPGAPSYAERMRALACAYLAGFSTSVSCEPMLTIEPVALLRAVQPFVTDTVWFGLLNDARARLSINGSPGNVAASAGLLDVYWTYATVRDLYDRIRDVPCVRWKDSIKRLLGLPGAGEKGLDQGHDKASPPRKTVAICRWQVYAPE
jgi:hypothetical protein